MLSLSTKVSHLNFNLSRKPGLICIYFFVSPGPSVFIKICIIGSPSAIINGVWVYYLSHQELVSGSCLPKTQLWIKSHSPGLIGNLTSGSRSQASQHTPEVLILGTWASCFPSDTQEQSRPLCPGMSPKSKRVDEVSMLQTGWMGSYREAGKTKTKKREVQKTRSCSWTFLRAVSSQITKQKLVNNYESWALA